jgi:RNA polymerase sigma factor (sigma-70 family)
MHMTRKSPTLLLRYLRGLAESGEVGELPDRVLVERFADRRDEAAFAALVHRHGALVLSVCRRLLDQEQDVEDVFQAVFLVLSRKAAGLRQKEAVGPWLFGVAHRLALRARQQEHNRRKRETLAGACSTGSVLDELTVREAQVVLDEELACLPERDRAPLLLCYLQGLTRDEAAQRLGCPLGTLKHRLARARDLLQRRLTRRGMGRSTVLATLLLTRPPAAVLAADLVSRTVQAGIAFAGSTTASGAVGLQAAALAQSVLKVTLLGKIKLAVVCVLTMLACWSLGRWPSIDAQRPAAQGVDRTVAQEDDRPKPPATPPVLARNEGHQATEPIHPPVPLARRPAAATKIEPQWRSDHWQEHARLAGHQAPVRAVTFAPDSTRLVSAGDDGRLRVWDAASKKELRAVDGLKARSPRAVALGAEDTLAVGMTDGTVLLWDLRGEGGPQTAHPLRGAAIQALTFGDNGRTLAWGRTDGAVEWDRKADGGIPPFAGEPGKVNSLALSRAGRSVAWGMQDGTVKLWDAIDRKQRNHFRIHSHPVWCLAFSVDGRQAASADHFATLVVWDSATGRTLLEQAHCKGGPPATVAFSPDGRVVALAAATGIHLWNIESGRQLADLPGQPRGVHALAFSPNGQFLAAAGSDGSVTIWMASPAEP